MPKIVPTVGRIVHFTLAEGKNRGQVRPAMITRVWNDDCVQLSVFTEVNDGLPPVHQQSSVVHCETPAEPGAAGIEGRWFWMPYQLGQAARTEAAEAKVAPTV